MQTGLEFPKSLSEKYRPTSFDSFVGLEKVKRVLSKFALAPFSTSFLFVGASGTGKTSAAMALSEAIHGELWHVPSQNCNVATLEDICRQCHYVPQAGAKWHLVLIDELDSASPAAQLALLSKLDGTAQPPNTIFCFTANSVEKLQDRLLSRCMTLEFSSHGMSTGIAALLQQVWEKEAPDAPAPNFARLVKDAGNNVRDAVNSLQVELLAV